MDMGMDRMRSALADELASGWPVRGEIARRVRAAIGHALSFHTWRSLVREQRLTNDEAVALMRRLVGSAAGA